MQVPEMIPTKCVHVFDVTAVRRWVAEREAKAVEPTKSHDPTKVYSKVSDLFGNKKAQTMGEWLAISAEKLSVKPEQLAEEVVSTVKTRGSVPTEPTPGVRIWVDEKGSIRFNPDMVCSARQDSPLRARQFPNERGDWAHTRITNAATAWRDALATAKRSAWTHEWWLEQQAA
jgi:hypothetical protein